MTTVAELRDPVRTQIRDAFGATPYPGDDDLVASADDRDPEALGVARAFRGKAWPDVSAAMVREHKEALPLFTPAGFRYYLPAYMIACIDHRDEIDVALDGAIFNLTPPRARRGWKWAWFEARARLFTAPERDAIRGFLELMAQHDVEDWASAGRAPPVDRVQPALAFWRGRQAG